MIEKNFGGGDRCVQYHGEHMGAWVYTHVKTDQTMHSKYE